MVRIRESKEERNANQLKKLEENFTNQVDKFNLKDLSLEQLVSRYEAIDQQSQIFKGLILLEARNRFKSNNEFGDWVKTVQTLCLDRQEVRTRYMNLARYFKDKEMLGISLTVAYEISAPANEQIADNLYEYVKGKDLKVSEVKKKAQELKKQLGIALPATDSAIAGQFLLSNDLQTYKDTILDGVQSLPSQDAIQILKLCLKELQEKSKKENSIQEAESISETSQAS